MVLIDRPNFGRDLVFVAKMAAAALIALCFGLVWYGLIGWAMVWSLVKVVSWLW